MIVMHIGEQTLGEKLRELRESYDLSQGQVAAALNIDRSTYTNYELDKTRPSLEMLVKLAHIFNVPRDTFLPDDDTEPSFALRDIVRPNSMAQSLNKEERGLVAQFRTLTRDQKDALLSDLSGIIKKKSPDSTQAD